jgi:hypothetical protein
MNVTAFLAYEGAEIEGYLVSFGKISFGIDRMPAGPVPVQNTDQYCSLSLDPMVVRNVL